MNLLHSQISGQGKPLIILHGFLGMSDNWKTLAKQYSKFFEVHLVDLRNHGKSFHSDAFTYKLMVDDLKYYIANYNLTKCNVIGHSMGGKVAMLFAVTNANLIEKLVVADISPRHYEPHHQTILEALQSIDFAIHNSRKLIEQELRNHVSGHGVVQFLLKNVYRKDKLNLGFRFNLDSLAANYNSELGKELPEGSLFKSKTLFLKGENSDYITPTKDHNLIQLHFPNSEIITVKNAGHWLHSENSTDFLRYSMTFFDQN